MDYSDSNVGAAKEILKGGAEVKRGSTYEIPYRATSMDICLCLDVFERIDDDTRAVSEIAHVLKPGGIPVTGGPATYYWSQYGKLIGISGSTLAAPLRTFYKALLSPSTDYLCPIIQTGTSPIRDAIAGSVSCRGPLAP